MTTPSQNELEERIRKLEARVSARAILVNYPADKCQVCGAVAFARCAPCLRVGNVTRLCDTVCAGVHGGDVHEHRSLSRVR